MATPSVSKDRSVLLHILRNPHGWGEDTVREARQKAASELERLWAMEHTVTTLANELRAATGDHP